MRAAFGGSRAFGGRAEDWRTPYVRPTDRVDTRDTRVNTREYGSMFDHRAERADTHTRGAPTGPAFSGRVMIRQHWGSAIHGS
jgi:hypothetical protein